MKYNTFSTSGAGYLENLGLFVYNVFVVVVVVKFTFIELLG